MTPGTLDQFKIPSDLGECQRKLMEAVDILKQAFGRLSEKDEKIQELEHQLQVLLRSKYGRSSESIDPGQLRLFDGTEEALERSGEIDSVRSEALARTSRHGRRRPSRELPRRRIVLELSEEERCCPGCGQQRVPIGEEISERYGYNPASVEVIEEVRVKYRCDSCPGCTIVTAATSEKPIPKGLADGSMIAYIAVSKFADHVPLHRLEGIFKRHGAEIARSTMCDWLAAAGDLVLPLYERMKQRVLSSRVIWTDDTPVNLQDRSHEENMRIARIWVYAGDRENSFTLYDFTESRKRDGPVAFLKDFKGFLQADAYAGYDHVYAGMTVDEVACWAHARRKFFDALKSNRRSASKALRHIQLLYRIEKRHANRGPEVTMRIRQSRSVKILGIFKTWLDTQVLTEAKGPLSKAVRYALNNWEALQTFTKDGELMIDNNKAERALRSIAVGRKNWLFVGSKSGGKHAAVLCSLIASCKTYNIDPLAYLTDVLNRLASIQPVDVDTLLPDRWRPAV